MRNEVYIEEGGGNTFAPPLVKDPVGAGGGELTEAADLVQLRAS